MDYWKIWYEIYMDGELVKRGLYPRSYRRKDSASKRAYKMWGKSWIDPVSGKKVTYGWTISETNPWEK